MNNGSFWYGKSTGFPGYLYKKNTGVGARKSTKMTPGGNATCNQNTYKNNVYVSGSGVGATNTSVRRSKAQHASRCCDKPKIKNYDTEFVYSFTLLEPTTTNTLQTSNKRMTSMPTTNIQYLLRPFIPVSVNDGVLDYYYEAKMYANNFVVVTIFIWFVDNFTTTDGITFNNVSEFYNTYTRDLTVNRFSRAPLSRAGRQFSETQIVFNATDAPTILKNTSLSHAFSNVNNNANFTGDLANWDMSGVTDMTRAFYQAYIFNSVMVNWDLSNVVYMDDAFVRCLYLTGELVQWNLNKVVSMPNAFLGCKRMVGSSTFILNAPIVQSLGHLFEDCGKFNPLHFVLHTPLAKSLSHVFYNCAAFNPTQFRLNTTNVEDFESLFHGCSKFNPTPSAFYLDTQRARSFKNTFNGCSKFNPTSITLNTRNATTTQGMFMGCLILNVAELSFETNNVTDMSYMFAECRTFNGDISSFNTSNVTTMSNMFNLCLELNQLITFITSKVIAMDRMFAFCVNYNPLSFTFDMSKVETTSSMFYVCFLFNPVEFVIAAPNLNDASDMFRICEAFNPSTFEINGTVALENVFQMFSVMSNFNPPRFVLNTSLVTSFSSMFTECSNFNPPVFELDTANGTYFEYMFEGCSSFSPSTLPFKTTNAISFRSMFSFCSNFNADLTYDGDIWNTTTVTNMSGLFSSVNEIHSSVQTWIINPNLDMRSMFRRASNAVLNLNGWTITNQRTSAMLANTTNFNVTWQNQTIVNGSNRQSGMFFGSNNFVGNLTGWIIASSDPLISFEFFNYTTDFKADVSNWKVVGNMSNFCANSTNFNIDHVGLDTWDTSEVTIFATPFQFSTNCSTLGLENWDTSSFVDLTRLFSGLPEDQVGFANDWVVTNVTKLDYLCETLTGITFTAADFSSWDTSNVTSMTYFFKGVSAFQGVGLELWNLPSLADITGMFANTSGFNYTNAKDLDISNVSVAENLFSYSIDFQEDLGDWSSRLTNITSLAGMFKGCDDTFSAAGLDLWVSLPMLTNISGMFRQTNNFTYDKVSNLILNSSVEDMSYLFALSKNFSSDLTAWRSSLDSVITFRGIFSSTNYDLLSNFNGQGIDVWDVSKAKDFSYAFEGAINLDLVCVESWNPTGAENFSHMFFRSTGFNNDLSGWDVSSVSDYSYIFSEVNTAGPDIGINLWNTAGMLTLEGGFSSAYDFSSQVTNWDTSLCVNMDNLFQGPDVFEYGTPSPPYIGFTSSVGDWNVSSVKSLRFAFSKTIFYGSGAENWVTTSLEDLTGAFSENGYGYIPINPTYDATFTQTWNLQSLTTMDYFLENASGVKMTFPPTDTLALTSMEGAFQNLNSTSNKCELTGFDSVNTTNVTNMSRVFLDANINPTFALQWNYLTVTNFNFFAYGSTLNFDMAPILSQALSATSMVGMVGNCVTFTGEGLKSLQAPLCTNFTGMCGFCENLNLAFSNMQYVEVSALAAATVPTMFVGTPQQGVASMGVKAIG